MSDPKARSRFKISPSLVAAVLSGHSAVGLSFAALIYILCFSGTVAVFSDEVLRWEQPQGPFVADVTPEIIGRAAEAGYAQVPELGFGDELFIQLPSDDFPRLQVQIADHITGSAQTWFADAEGALVHEQRAPWWGFLLALHFRLLLPGLWGLIVVGLSGVFLLTLIFSGVLAHPRIFKDAFHLRRGGSKRLQEADLHNRLSVWGLPFHIAIAFTGAYLALAPIMNSFLVDAAYDGDLTRGFGELYGPGPEGGDGPAPIPDLRAIIEDAIGRFPGSSVETIIVQEMATQHQLVHVTTKHPAQMNEFERNFYNGDGELLRTAGYDDGPAGIQWAAAMTPLHYGWFGGWVVKLVYGILGAALTVITASGVTIWLARWSDKGRPRTGWQRVWTAIVWGQPLAFGASALVALLGPASWVAPSYLAVVFATLYCAAVVKTNIRLSRFLRLSVAASLMLLVLLHSILWPLYFVDGMAGIINMTITILAVSMIVSASRGQRTVPVTA